ncbi:MAG: hypothetical protein ACOCPX_02850 [Halapricum sp.]
MLNVVMAVTGTVSCSSLDPKRPDPYTSDRLRFETSDARGLETG